MTNTIKLSPQAALVLRHLRLNGSITNVEAHMVHKVRSVSRRITEIQDAGYVIDKINKTDTTGQRYVKYVLNDFASRLHHSIHLRGVDVDRIAA